MKKSVILAVLGLGAAAASSFGQGAIVFNSYFANSASSGATKITFLSGGALVGAGYSYDIYYSTSPVSGAAGTGALPAGMLASGSGAPSTYDISGTMGNYAAGAGYFASSVHNFTLSAGGPTVYFDVAVFTTGDTYANAPVRGQSGVFTGVLQSGINNPTYAQFGSFTIAAVPEPTTLALAGLGGLASLVALRRKQA
jgi:hypothetical protein